MFIQLRSSKTLRVLSYYLAFSTLWILSSDFILHLFFDNLDSLSRAQSFKGIAFVVATTLLLGTVLHHEHKLALRATQAASELESELSKQSAALRTFVDHAPAAVAMFDRDMCYMSASGRWLQTFDLDADIIGKDHYALFPNLPHHITEAHRRSMAGEIVRTTEDLYIDANGLEHWFTWETRPWHGSDGSVGGIVVFIEDVSERKRLLDHLTLYSSVFTEAREGIMITDKHSRILDVNDAFTEITGYEREDVLGENPRVLQSGLQSSDFYKDLWKEIDETGQWYGEIQNKRKDGQLYPEFLTISTVKNGAGEVEHYVAHFFDLSRQKQIEEALEETELSLASITGSMQDIVFTIDTDEKFTGLFGPWVPKFGVDPELFLGRTIAEIIGEAEAKPHLVANAAALKGEFTVYDWEIDTVIGHRHFQTSLSPIFSADGAVTGVVGVGRDMTDLKVAEHQTKIQLQRLSSLRAVDTAISGTFELSITLKIILDEIISQLGVQAADILLFNQHSQTLSYAAGQGFKSRDIERSRVKLGEGVAGCCLLDRRRLRQQFPLQSLFFNRGELIRGESFEDYFAVPMIAKGHPIGVLEVFLGHDSEPTDEWLEFLDTLAELAAIAVDNARLFGELLRSHLDVVLAYDATIEGWSKALDLRDKETEGHTQRVTELTERLAKAVGVEDEELVQMRRGALLHDIGKMGVPDSILLKEGPLTDEERAVIQTHPDLAYHMLSPIEFLRPALDIPYAHHERWDGTGYPRGLKGAEIPLSARLFALVDVWDALRSDRPYRKAWPRERVLEHIRAGSGTHFDPHAVEAFMSLMAREGDEIEVALGYDKMSA